MSISSDINLNLPAVPQIKDPIMFKEFMKLYDAIRTLQVELSTLKAQVNPIQNK